MTGTQDNTDKAPMQEPAARKTSKFFRRRFTRDGKGSVSIEFAALALPFSMLVFAILESGISFGAQQIMSNATDGVARSIRTGQLRPADLNEATLKGHICKKLKLMVSAGCPGLEVDLRSYPTFEQAAAQRIKLTADRDIDTSGFAVTPGPALSINMLRVFYRWPVMTDMMRSSMSNIKGNKTLLFATSTWRNEPFND